MKYHPPVNLSLEIKGVVPAFPLWWCLKSFFIHPLDKRRASLGLDCVVQWHKWEDRWGVSRCPIALSGWFPDKDTGARAGPWLYLPGPEGWSPAAESHRQLLQKGAHRVCPRSHREGKLCGHKLVQHLFNTSWLFKGSHFFAISAVRSLEAASTQH